MQRRSLRLLALAIFCILLGTATWFAARWAEKLPQRLAAASEALLREKAWRLREKFFALANFQPQMRVNEKVVSEMTTEIAEIAVLEKQIEVEREFSHTWAGSTKMLRLRGKFKVKAGYNLLERFEIQVRKGRSRVLLPPASLLSVEQEELKIETLENGLWNPVSADDLQTSIASLKELARNRSQPLVGKVDATFAERLRRFVGEDVEIETVKLEKNAL